MTFQLTVGVLLAYMVPGLFAAWATTYFIVAARSFFLRPLEDPTAGSAIAVGILLFSLGAITDSIRAVFLDRYLDLLRRAKPPANYLQKLTKDNLPVFLMLIERTQEYYRLNGNCCVALAFLFIAMVVKFRGTNHEIFVLFGLMTTFLAAWKSRKETLWAMEQFSSSSGGGC